MDVSSLKIAKVFSGGGEVHYVLPHFQREYAWDKVNWQTLLDDVLSIYEAYDPDNEPEHFMGALVVIRDGMRSGTIPAFKLVDGQQRLTTISLCLCALSEIVIESNPPLYRKIRKLLENPDEEGIVRYKLVPTTKYGDRDAYINVVSAKPNFESDSRIPEAYDYLLRQLKSKINTSQLDPERLFLVFANCMHVVFIDLDQREKPYEIFESLNAKSKPLTQPDLVRNYIAMKLPESRQEDAFHLYWSTIENTLRDSRTVSRIGELTAFLRHYLASHFGILINTDHVYARFRDRMETEFVGHDAFVGEIKKLHRFADYYNRLLRPEAEADPEIRNQLLRLNTLESFTAYPFLMRIYDYYEQRLILKSEFLEALQILENYLVRRYLAGEQSNYTNKMFPALEREIDRARFLESLKKALTRKNYPSDNRIRQVLPALQVYDTRKYERLVLILESVNRHLSRGSGGHTVLDGQATVEHLMPQTLGERWKTALGPTWEEVYREYLHTIGNLTLVTQEWNSTLSNSAFEHKRQRLVGHALLLNSLYFQEHVDEWNEETIKRRANALVDEVLEIWPSFGDPPAALIASGQKPVGITIFGVTYEASSWRDVAIHMAEEIARLQDDFDDVAASLPAFFSREERVRSRQLSNGWWLYVNLSANSVLNLCDALASQVSLPSDGWEINFSPA